MDRQYTLTLVVSETDIQLVSPRGVVLTKDNDLLKKIAKHCIHEDMLMIKSLSEIHQQ